MGKLKAIAKEMRQVVELPGARFCYRVLGRGLELVLQRTEDRWRLALGRTDVPPSDDEVEVCCLVFGVPANVEPQRLCKERQGKTGVVVYYVVEVFWSEVRREGA